MERTNRAIGCADIRAARWRLERQEPVVNQTLAYHGLRLLASLFRYGEVDPHGAFVNLATGRAVALRVGPECWKRMRRRGRQLRRRRQAA